jgi:hypothetical protein
MVEHGIFPLVRVAARDALAFAENRAGAGLFPGISFAAPKMKDGAGRAAPSGVSRKSSRLQPTSL